MVILPIITIPIQKVLVKFAYDITGSVIITFIVWWAYIMLLLWIGLKVIKPNKL